jgi:hypothetical protein
MKIFKPSFLFLIFTSIFFSCQKEYSVENAITPAGSWQFNDAAKLYIGNIDTAYIETANTTKTMTLQGRSSDGQQNFLLHLYDVDSFTVGTYKASLFENDFELKTQAKTLYLADQFIGEFLVNITAIANNSVTGTFSGDAEDSSGVKKPLTLGKFTSRINLVGNGNGGGTGTGMGTLGANAGICTPATPAGIYTQGVTLSSSNTVAIQVTVTTPGSYTISTNLINGVTFSGSGTFTATGPQTVILQGSGTPVSSGSQTFTVTFGASSCTFSISFTAGTSPATGTLGGAPGTCTNVTTAGVYTQGTPLNSTNTLQVQVNVTTIGAYTISANTVNGVSFSKSGSFTTTGLQNVTLNGTGTPVAAGPQIFTLTFGTSTCNFSITFLPGTTPPLSLDYFPMTAGSFWHYGNVMDATDSFMVTATSGMKTITGLPYNIFNYNDLPPIGSPDSLYYRKSGGLYFENFNVQTYFGAPGTPPDVEYKFLDTTVAVGTSWQSSNFTVTDQGTTYTLYIKMTLFEKVTTSTTVGSVTSSAILKVKYDYYAGVAPIPGTVFFKEERWFARGVGLVYNSFDDLSGSPPEVYKIGAYKVF